MSATLYATDIGSVKANALAKLCLGPSVAFPQKTDSPAKFAARPFHTPIILDRRDKLSIDPAENWGF
jgi:hypothetical protein